MNFGKRIKIYERLQEDESFYEYSQTMKNVL